MVEAFPAGQELTTSCHEKTASRPLAPFRFKVSAVAVRLCVGFAQSCATLSHYFMLLACALRIVSQAPPGARHSDIFSDARRGIFDTQYCSKGGGW